MSGLKPLSEHDPELADILQCEMARQYRGLEMIASENFTSRAVLECLGSAFTNKYSEGEVGNRYYGGNEYIDKVEALAKQRALAAFNLSPAEWGVNVQPYSGSPANFAAYTAVLRPHDRLMGLHLPGGGHLTHGFYTAKKKISATSIYFESMPYNITEEGIIDYAELERVAEVYMPSLIILGGSAYPRDYDYDRVRKLVDKLGCYLLMDMAHTAGLIAGGVLRSPFEYCDIVTTTTHKSLRGPRAGMIFFRKVRDGKSTDLEQRVNQAVFPGLQGGPHEHQIAAIATQMLEVATPEFKVYAAKVQSNARALAAAMLAKGHALVTSGTDNHLIMWNLRPFDVTGSKMEKILEKVSISSNKNAIAGDKSALTPGGIRLGTCALTTRGMEEKHMETVAAFLDRSLRIAVDLQKVSGKPLNEFVAAVNSSPEVAALRKEVEEFAVQFSMPGFDVDKLKYKDGLPH